MSLNLALSFHKLSLYGARPLPLVSVVAQRGLKTNSTGKSANAKVPKEKTTTKKVKAAPKPKIEKPRYKDSIFAGLPKRPHSAWQIYLTDHLPEIQSNGKVSVSVATEKLGPQWRGRSFTDVINFNKPYVDRWAKEKVQWTSKREAILAKATPYQIYRENLLRKKLGEPLVKDPNAPKKAKNGFMYFIEELRNTGQADFSQGITHQAKEAGEKWNHMSAHDKKKYLDKAQHDSERYHKEIAVYNAKIHANH